MLNLNVDKIVVVDSGKNSIKVFTFSSDYELLDISVFPSKSKKKRNFADIDSSGENQFKIEIDNEKYLIGEGIPDNYNFETTKNNLHNKLCIYTAIANSVVDKNEKIKLIVGYPSSDFTNETKRNEYVDLLKSDKVVEMKVNGKDKSFLIKNISVYPEGIALKPRMINPNKVVQIVDLGGQNLNYRLYDLKGNTLNSFSLDKAGINHLEEYFRTQLRKFVEADKVDISSIDVLGAIKNKEIKELNPNYLTAYKSTEEFVVDTVLSFLENQILGQLISKGVNLYQRGNFIIFTGGGSLLLSPYFKMLLENNEGNIYFSSTAQFDNCISYVIKDLGDICKNRGLLKEASVIGQKILNEIDALLFKK